MGLKYIDTDKVETTSKVKYIDDLELTPKETRGSLLGKTPQAMAAFGLGIPAAIGVGKAIKGGIDVAKMGKTALSANFGRGDTAKNFADAVRKSFIQAHTDKVNEFGSKLSELAAKNPTKSVSLTETIEDIVKNWDDLSTNTKSAIKNTPILGKFIGKSKEGVMKVVGKPETVSLADTQKIINHINIKIPPEIKANNLDLLDTLNSVKAAQLSDFPEMKEVRASYAAFKEPYKQVKNYFKVNKLLSSIENKFGGAEGNVAVSKILPKEVFDKLKNYRMAKNLSNPAKALARGLLGNVGGMMRGVALGTLDPGMRMVGDPMDIISRATGQKETTLEERRRFLESQAI